MATNIEHQLIFIPGPGIGHIIPAVEIGKLIVSRDTRLSITFLLIDDEEVRQYTQSQPPDANPRLRFHNLPEYETPASSTPQMDSNPCLLLLDAVDRHKPQVREAILAITKTKTPAVAGVVVDMFSVNMIDVADEFGIPSYTFYTSSAAFLSLMLFVQSLTDEHGFDVTEYRDSDHEFEIPGYRNPVPAKALPSPMVDKNGGSSELVIHTARQIRKSRGIFINTFQELEMTPIQSFLIDSKIPPIYPVGPLIKHNNESDLVDNEIIRWLDQQPPSSVVFLCFGSKGIFSEAQIKHLADGLESSGHRFLWSLRTTKTGDFSSPDEVLPKGFLNRTSGIGKVIGWAPQVAVLSHTAVGGFVSHCGWNSILESLRHGVPMAAWPMYAEQEMNAFQMVVELGMAVEIKMMDGGDEVDGVVRSEVIERGVRKLMMESGVREKVKDVREKSCGALMEGGSSHRFLGKFIHDILRNSPTHNHY